ncbi:DUF397 domain-containing protein [Actinomadura bangladeshensis]|uniref:DUF397 domain-containing protein n=1 Tax=Actinomadura bangladeshensis TaxID=453573 RepID=UPI003C79956D
MRGVRAAVLGRDDVVGVRDSTDPDGPHLVLTQDAWDALLVYFKDGGSVSCSAAVVAPDPVPHHRRRPPAPQEERRRGPITGEQAIPRPGARM